MHFQTVKFISAMILLYSLQSSVALPKSACITNSPLLLNGHVMNTSQFAHVTRGVLTVVRGDAASGQPVPFLIYLKRNGKIVDADAYAHNFAVLRYEIAEILESAQAGDQLVIDPVWPGNAADRKIITIKGTQILPRFQWLNQKKDNC